MKVLLTPFNDVRIADRIVIVTDGDKHTVEEGKELPGNLRKDQFDTLASQGQATAILDVIVNTYSLETELVAAGNEALLKAVFLDLHPRSEAKWDEAVAKTGDDDPESIQALFETTPKGDLPSFSLRRWQRAIRSLCLTISPPHNRCGRQMTHQDVRADASAERNHRARGMCFHTSLSRRRQDQGNGRTGAASL